MDFEPKLKTLKIKNRLIYFDKPGVLGIINLTPDSFYSESQTKNMDDAISKAGRMLEEGADFLDIGAYSSRPGAKHISEREEMERLIPPLKAIVESYPEAIISVDTFRSNIAHAAVEAGAAIVNDISAGESDKKMFETVAGLQVPVILMHMQGTPQNMQHNPNYENVTREVMGFLEKKSCLATDAGIHDVIVDPGFGFGKTMSHNYTLLKNLGLFRYLEKPLLVGVSRKSMIYKAIKSNPEGSLTGTAVLNTLALINGADILRVHDVREAKEAIKLVDLYYNPITEK